MTELLTSLIVLGILLTIAYSTLGRRVPNYELKAAAQELHGSMQRAKAMAIKNNRNVGLEFVTGCSPAGGQYHFFIDDGAGSGTSKNNILDGNEQSFLNVSLPSDVCITSTTWPGNNAGFTANGIASSAGEGSVILSHQKISQTYKISLFVSGGIKLEY